MGHLRGQMWSIDFIIGIMVLSFILMLYLIMWNTITIRWSTISKATSMDSSAFFAAESVMVTPGEPESWEMLPHIDGNVSAIGLANGRNELSRMKLEKLVAENATAYDTIKNRLGIQRHEFGMRVTDITKNTMYYEFGKFSAGALNNSLSFDRLGLLDGQPVIVHMEVWGK